MDLREAIANSTPRERSGSTAADRFEYQRDWALCKLLVLHQSKNDYLLAFDAFDDVILMNGENEPDRIAFFQIKTRKTRSMTLRAMLKQEIGETGPLPSMIGKLYYNKILFPENTEALTLVSNAPFSITLINSDVASTGFKTLRCVELDQQTRNSIRDQLKKEHGLATEPEFVDITSFEVAELPLEGHATFALGRLAEFLETLNPEGSFKPRLIYRTIADEIKRKNNYDGRWSSFDEFLREKGLGRKGFDQVLKTVGAHRDFDWIWSRIEDRLNAEQMPILQTRRLRDVFRRYSIDRASRKDVSLPDLEAVVKGAIGSGTACQQADTASLLNWIVQGVRLSAKSDEFRRYEDDYIRVIGLVAFYDE